MRGREGAAGGHWKAAGETPAGTDETSVLPKAGGVRAIGSGRGWRRGRVSSSRG